MPRPCYSRAAEFNSEKTHFGDKLYDRDFTVRSECGLVALAGCLPPCIPLPDSGGL